MEVLETEYTLFRRFFQAYCFFLFLLEGYDREANKSESPLGVRSVVVYVFAYSSPQYQQII